MKRNKIILIIIAMIIANFNKAVGQKIVIDEMYRIQMLIELKSYDSAIAFTKKLNDSLKCKKNEILGFSYGKLGKHDLAAQYYENYLKDCIPTSIQLINLGDNYFKLGQLTKAKEQFIKVNDDDANYSLAQYDLGMIEYETGNKEKAAEYFTSALKNVRGETLDFDYVEMQIKTLNELKEYDVALESIDIILKIWDKNSIEYKYTLIIKSSIFGAREEYEKGIKILEEMVHSGIDDKIVLLEAYSYQLEFYSKLNRRKKACSIYEIIRTLDPLAEVLKKYNCE